MARGRARARTGRRCRALIFAAALAVAGCIYEAIPLPSLRCWTELRVKVVVTEAAERVRVKWRGIWMERPDSPCRRDDPVTIEMLEDEIESTVGTPPVIFSFAPESRASTGKWLFEVTIEPEGEPPSEIRCLVRLAYPSTELTFVQDGLTCTCNGPVSFEEGPAVRIRGIEVVPAKPLVGTQAEVRVKVQNSSLVAETFPVHLSAQPVPPAPGRSSGSVEPASQTALEVGLGGPTGPEVVLSYAWDLAGAAPGRHLLTARAEISDETPEDNQRRLQVTVRGDDDGDGIADPEDNCIGYANPSQTDVDADGLGNRCDVDFNNDGTHNLPDFMACNNAWGARAGEPAYDELCDLDLGDEELTGQEADRITDTGPNSDQEIYNALSAIPVSRELSGLACADPTAKTQYHHDHGTCDPDPSPEGCDRTWPDCLSPALP